MIDSVAFRLPCMCEEDSMAEEEESRRRPARVPEIRALRAQQLRSPQVLRSQGAPRKRSAAPKEGRRQAEEGQDYPGDIVIERPGSDFMIDVIKALDLEYMSTNPGSSFRSLHESLVNYGGNRSPSSSPACTRRRRSRWRTATRRPRASPMGALVHGTVGPAARARWRSTTPGSTACRSMIFAGNGLDATKRRPGTEWNHSVQDPRCWCATS